MKKYLLFILLSPLVTNAQKNNEEGILFEKNITREKWNLVFEKAKKTDKYIFVYCMYPNPASLSYLESQFSNDSTIDFFNKYFYCLELPINWNKTIDSKTIAAAFAETYKIRVLPTFLIFSCDGKLLHKFSSSRFWFGKDSILSAAKNIFNQDKQYGFLIDKFEKGCNDASFYKKLFDALHIADYSTDEYVSRFIQTRDNLFTNENAEILMESHSYNVALDYLFNNQDKWKRIIDSSILHKYYQQKIYNQIQEFGRNYYYSIGRDSLINYFDKKYIGYGKFAAIKFAIHQPSNYRNESFIEELVNNYIDSTVLSEFSLWDYNSLAWEVFLKVDNNTLLTKALLWSKKCIEQAEEPAYLDTYANLLYKLGRKQEAIEFEEKAIALLKDEADKKSYVEVLEKMKQGKKTWK